MHVRMQCPMMLKVAMEGSDVAARCQNLIGATRKRMRRDRLTGLSHPRKERNRSLNPTARQKESSNTVGSFSGLYIYLRYFLVRAMPVRSRTAKYVILSLAALTLG